MRFTVIRCWQRMLRLYEPVLVGLPGCLPRNRLAGGSELVNAVSYAIRREIIGGVELD